jgi:hypothetical protein
VKCHADAAAVLDYGWIGHLLFRLFAIYVWNNLTSNCFNASGGRQSAATAADCSRHHLFAP